MPTLCRSSHLRDLRAEPCGAIVTQGEGLRSLTHVSLRVPEPPVVPTGRHGEAADELRAEVVFGLVLKDGASADAATVAWIALRWINWWWCVLHVQIVFLMRWGAVLPLAQEVDGP